MSTIEALIGKPLHECSEEELTEFIQSRRRDITAIMEDVEGGSSGSTVKVKSSSRVISAATLAEMEENL